MSSPTETARAALDFLKGKENPFESLARPQRLDESFLDLHVPELLAKERGLLLQIIDRYRVAEFTRAADLPATRVVTILGDRGAGKTHLLRSLSYREDGKSQILVRPSYYDVNLPFDEYLLSQLTATLLAEDEVFHTRPIEDIAGALVPRLLRQTLRTLGPTDRVFALGPSRWQRWRLLLGGADHSSQGFDKLAALLEGTPIGADVPELLRDHRLAPEQAMRLLLGHLRKFEAGPDLLSGLRRELYAAMARAVLFKENESLLRWLEGGCTQTAGAATRIEIVAKLLHALTEICALVRQPIVFAFDNLERLFSPRNAFDGDLTRNFWNTLAQTVDNTRGLLILIFAERGLFEKAAKLMDEFARSRIEQGVPIFGRGPVGVVNLHPPETDEINALIHGRIGRLLRDFPAAAELPASFPFDGKLPAGPAAASQSLRGALLRLRDQYSQLVYAQAAPAPEPATAVNWESLLQSKWNEQFTAAGRKMSASLATHLQEIHAGLAQLLELVLPLPLEGWVLHDAQATANIGDNPTYGVVSLLHWRRQEGAETNGSTLKMGVGFLLARGTGMPVDLRAKFDFFRRPALGDWLLIFWPAPSDGDDPVELLPPATRTEWDKTRAKKKTTLKRVDQNDLRGLLILSEWLNDVQTATDQPVPREILQAFVKERFQSLLQLVNPPMLQGERILADEN